MIMRILCLMLLVFTNNILFAQYSKHFEESAMRFDFMHSGGMGTEDYAFVGVAEEPIWGGNRGYLIDTTYYGIQKLEVRDAASGELIYSKCYNTLFNEWLDTHEAATMKRSYPESVQFPFPKNKVIVEIYSRSLKDNSFTKRFSHTVDPNSYEVNRSKPGFVTFDVQYNGHYGKKVDIVILGDGYAANEEALFRADCAKFVEQIFAFSPYKERRGDFNVRAVWTPSKDSGASIPGEGLWLDTHFGAHFYTFGSERYYTISDYTTVCKAAGTVPYDNIYIIGNTLKYGGGGIYNFYGMGSARNKELAGEVHIHEIGHSFASLGDEYAANGYTNEYFSSEREPWEENLTTLKDFSKKKIWNSLLGKGVKIPTEITKRSGKVVGVYEGGGYVEKGVYRPMVNCMMRSLGGDKTFCPVCTEAINQTINRYCK